jgi:glycosyltransferase involved in cell wall biosynthesis
VFNVRWDTAGAMFSVALCTHNGASYIEAQLRSIFDQTAIPKDIIVSDDSSSDDTVAIVERITAEYQRQGHPTTLTVLKNVTPLGVVKNFEQAVQVTSERYIALCDQDDVWKPNKLEVLGELFLKNPETLLFHSNAQLVDGNGNPLGLSLFGALGIAPSTLSREHEGDGFALLMKRNIVTGATVAFHSKLLTFALPFPANWVHDEWLAVIAAAAGRIDVCEAELIDYRQHADNQIGATALTVKGRWARLALPRNKRNRVLLDRAEELLIRLTDLSAIVGRGCLPLAQEKLEHERMRSSLRASRWARLIPVAQEIATGRYQRVGSGANDILRDLVQPSSERQKN